MANEKRLIDANAFLRESFFQEGIYPHEQLRKEIEKCPTVDAVEVVHGRWDKNWDGDNIVYCNQCYMPQDVPTQYCASCGAKMDGDGNE